MNSEIAYRIKEVTNECDRILFGSKDDDYNNSGIDILDYYPFPNEGLLHDINRKTLRLISLLGSDTEPKNESIEDNFKDLINYARIGYAIWRHYNAKTQKEEKTR